MDSPIEVVRGSAQRGRTAPGFRDWATYRCRYLLDGRWENDWQADAYSNDGGDDDSRSSTWEQPRTIRPEALDAKPRRSRRNTLTSPA
jgi:hypothetical protein